MISKWSHLKTQAIALRRKGYSLKDVERDLGIRRSTLSGWFKNVSLINKQRERLLDRSKNGLVFARGKAVAWHNNQKQLRMSMAKEAAGKTLEYINVKDKNILELALAMLYLGEGFKKSVQTGMGNSDPFILRFFIKSLKDSFNIDIKKIKCELHLRADQKPKKEVIYWSKQLDIPTINFGAISLDQRTVGRPTYPNYHGVCIVRCGNVAIQRRISYLAEMYCTKILGA